MLFCGNALLAGVRADTIVETVETGYTSHRGHGVDVRMGLRYVFVLFPGSLSVAFGVARAQESMPPGFSEVLRDAGAAFDRIDTTIKNVDSALEDCTALVEGKTGSPSAAYRDLEKSVVELEKQSKDLQSAVKKMEDRGNEFFKKWEGSLDAMSDVDRESSSELRDDVWRRYGKIAGDGVTSEVELRPVIEGLRALLDAIGGRVDAASLKSHRDGLDKLNDKATAWMKDARNRYRDAEKELRALEDGV